MYKIFVMIFLLLTANIFIYGETISTYDFVKVKTIPIGDKEGMIGWETPVAGGHSGPLTLFITKDNLFYIPDLANYRINIYNEEINYINTIKDGKKTYIAGSHKIFVDNSGNILGGISSYGIQKINSKGEELFNKQRKEIPAQIHQYRNLIVIDNYIFYYNDQNDVEYFTETGQVEKGKNVQDKLNDLAKAIPKESLYSIDGIILPAEKIKIFEELQKSLNYLITGDRFYSASFDDTEKYFEKIKAVRDYIIEQKIKNKFNIKAIKINIADYSPRLIGYDNEHNSYWDGISSYEINNQRKDAIIIYSKYGELLDVFYYSQWIDNRASYKEFPTTGACVAVAPNGDLYFLCEPKTQEYGPRDEYSEGGIVLIKGETYTFYKVPNQWSNRNINPVKQYNAVAISLTATSYNTYKNMYHPLKAFDGDIKTAWLEAAKGSGIGESITLELDSEITVDSIQVLPGLFDAKWWKSNNRVKALTMKIGDNTTTLQFQDEMKPHKADFKEPKTFKKVEFIIKEVYLSGKDDDTAITEIQFYYKGENIKLDFSKQEAELNKSK